MPSPFPGMDPYLESQWPDVHVSLIARGRDALNERLPDELVARSETRVTVDDDPDGPGGDRPGVGTFVPSRPDVRVVHHAATAVAELTDTDALGLDAPYELLSPIDAPVERYLRVTDAVGRLLTVVEFLSPSNKLNEGLLRLRRNRIALLGGGVHVVEVDLVRAGDWRATMDPWTCPAPAVTTYRAVVYTAGPTGRAFLYPMPLREPLPDVPVPLRPGVPPVRLPLQGMMTALYDATRYGRTIDYTRPADPPLDPDDAAWAAALLAGRSH